MISTFLVSYMPSASVLLLLLLLWLSWAIIRRSWKPAGLPPGPLSLPLIGSLLSMRGSDTREELRRLAGKYGDIFTMDLGSRRTVILASYDAIKEGLVKNAHALSGRPMDMFVFKDVVEGKGIVGTEGLLWKEQRKFIHSVFREFGVGRPVFEEKIQEEVTKLLIELNETLGVPRDPAPIIQKAVGNVINNVTFGTRYEYNDPRFLLHMAILERNMRIVGNSGLLTIIPSLKYLPGDLFEFKRLRREGKIIQDDFRLIIEEHRQSRVPGVIRDVIDAYLEEAERQKDNPDSTFNDEQLIFIIGDLFGAGTETTTTTLRWALLYLLHNREVLKRVQQEVETVVGPSRMPNMKDKPDLPYTEAVLLEAQRMGDIVPLGVPHKTTEEVTLGGYRIPAGMDVMTLLYAAHRDPKVWQDPYTFRPERFLDAQGQLCKEEHLIPFSMGRRVCLGESLARMELFLFFVALMQHFTFDLPANQPLPGLKGTLGITYIPPSFQLVIEQKS